MKEGSLLGVTAAAAKFDRRVLDKLEVRAIKTLFATNGITAPEVDSFLQKVWELCRFGLDAQYNLEKKREKSCLLLNNAADSSKLIADITFVRRNEIRRFSGHCSKSSTSNRSDWTSNIRVASALGYYFWRKKRAGRYCSSWFQIWWHRTRLVAAASREGFGNTVQSNVQFLPRWWGQQHFLYLSGHQFDISFRDLIHLMWQLQTGLVQESSSNNEVFEVYNKIEHHDSIGLKCSEVRMKKKKREISNLSCRTIAWMRQL